ncbi:hypothetical protein ACF3NA_01370 [Alkanindiges sp. WGS2144]|uniref:hypothetical protein n=1 Tax=Alkanindiges sp. WGS2144 TaxID=3366808 RepID=UPI003750736E
MGQRCSKLQASILSAVVLSLCWGNAVMAQDKNAIYVGRSKLAPEQYNDHHSRHAHSSRKRSYSTYPRVINKSPGYDASSGRSGISARLYYQAPSTTTITRNVHIIPPQNGVGDVYYSQDSYYLYPSAPVYPYPRQPGYASQPLIPVVIDPKATESRAKQWTDKSDFGR